MNPLSTRTTAYPSTLVSTPRPAEQPGGTSPTTASLPHFIRLNDATLYLGAPMGRLSPVETTTIATLLAPQNVHRPFGEPELDVSSGGYCASFIVSEPIKHRLLGTVKTDRADNIRTLVIQRLPTAAVTIQGQQRAPERPLTVDLDLTLHFHPLGPDAREEVGKWVRQQWPSGSEVGSGESSLAAWDNSQRVLPLNIAQWMTGLPVDPTGSPGIGPEIAAATSAGPASSSRAPEHVDPLAPRLLMLTGAAITAHAYRTKSDTSGAILQDPESIRAQLKAAGFDVEDAVKFRQALETLHLAPHRPMLIAGDEEVQLHARRLGVQRAPTLKPNHAIGDSLRSAGYRVSQKKLSTAVKGGWANIARQPGVEEVRQYGYVMSELGLVRLGRVEARQKLLDAGFSANTKYLDQVHDQIVREGSAGTH